MPSAEPASVRPGSGLAQPRFASGLAVRWRISPETLVFALLLALVLLVPLPLGSVSQLSWWIIATIVGVLLLVHAGLLLRPNAAIGTKLKPNWPWMAAFIAAAGWAGLQATSITPASWSNPLWDAASSVLETPLRGAISIDPFDTVSAMLCLLAYGGIFWLALQLSRARRRAEIAFLALTSAGFAYAAYGLSVKFTGEEIVLWFHKSFYLSSVTSTFINRNNYATYAGLGLICASGMIIKQFSGLQLAPASWKTRQLRILEALAGWRCTLLLAWITLVTALVLTESRGGVLSSFMGLLALMAAVTASRTLRRRHALMIGIIILLGCGAFAVFSGDQVAERLASTDLDQEERPIVYQLAREQIAREPWLGTGYGTFEEAFRLVQTESVKGHWDRAHNTYLENALELGIPAAVLLTLSAAALFIRCIIGLRKRKRDTIYPAMGVGATVLVACHALVDFSLQIPAISATYAFIIGVAVAQSWPSGRARKREDAMPY